LVSNIVFKKENKTVLSAQEHRAHNDILVSIIFVYDHFSICLDLYFDGTLLEIFTTHPAIMTKK
jgi:hypothetical protein